MCNWERGELIGKGSFASVHIVMPKTPNSPPWLVVKSALSKDHCLSLQREARILKGLVGCPEIIHCYGHESNIHYNLFLEYANGGCLLDLIIKKYGGKVPEPHVRHYTRMILKGLSFMHRRGFVHCDLKPENILVFSNACVQGSSHQLKIADFGVSKEPGEDPFDKAVNASNFRGTPYYMSPESVKEGRVIRPALDIWSLGCVVIEMLSGQTAWGEHLDMDDLYVYLVSEKYRRDPVIPENITEEAKDFLNKCLDREYEKRWSADQLLNHPFIVFSRY